MKKSIIISIISILIAVIILIVIIGVYFYYTSFSIGTVVNGVNCSLLSVEHAKNNILKEQNKEIKFMLVNLNNDNNSKEENLKYYTLPKDELEFNINSDILKQELEKQKKQENTKEINSPNLFTINENNVKKAINVIKQYEEKNMLAPVNASLKVNDNNLVEIESEKYGNKLDFNKAMEYTITNLKKGNTEIDFSPITDINPKILSTNESLNNNKDEINSFLETKIEFELSNGAIATLDKKIMSNWIEQNDSGYYIVNIEKNLPYFVDALDRAVDTEDSVLNFNTTGKGEISAYVYDMARGSINKGEQLKIIKKALEEKKSGKLEIIYEQNPINYLMKNYVELDITRQKVWVYKNGNLVLQTSCVTGNTSEGNGTPSGVFMLRSKETNVTLTDEKTYSSFVNYWMPFNGGIGFHDATWRSSFGGNIYKTDSSHGCVNLPYKAAKNLFEIIDYNMPIIVYAS